MVDRVARSIVTCPSCGVALDPHVFLIADRIGVCSSCARSLVREGEAVRLATGADMATLSAVEVNELRRARPSAWRQATQARLNQILASKG